MFIEICQIFYMMNPIQNNKKISYLKKIRNYRPK